MRTSPGLSNVIVRVAPLRYRPRSNFAPGDRLKTLWKMPSRFGKSTVAPTGTAEIRGLKRLLFDAMRGRAEGGSRAPGFGAVSGIQTTACGAGDDLGSGPRIVTVTRSSPTPAAGGACTSPPARPARTAIRAAVPAARVKNFLGTCSAILDNRRPGKVLRERPAHGLDAVPQAAREVSLPEKLGNGIGVLLEEARPEPLMGTRVSPHEELAVRGVHEDQDPVALRKRRHPEVLREALAHLDEGTAKPGQDHHADLARRSARRLAHGGIERRLVEVLQELSTRTPEQHARSYQLPVDPPPPKLPPPPETPLPPPPPPPPPPMLPSAPPISPSRRPSTSPVLTATGSRRKARMPKKTSVRITAIPPRTTGSGISSSSGPPERACHGCLRGSNRTGGCPFIASRISPAARTSASANRSLLPSWNTFSWMIVSVSSEMRFPTEAAGCSPTRTWPNSVKTTRTVFSGHAATSFFDLRSEVSKPFGGSIAKTISRPVSREAAATAPATRLSFAGSRFVFPKTGPGSGGIGGASSHVTSPWRAVAILSMTRRRAASSGGSTPFGKTAERSRPMSGIASSRRGGAPCPSITRAERSSPKRKIVARPSPLSRSRIRQRRYSSCIASVTGRPFALLRA